MSDFPVKEEDKVNGIAIVVIGLATTAVLWASVIALQAYFQDSEGEIAAERAASGQTDGVRGLLAKQDAELHRHSYADPSKGTLKRLNIDQAMRSVVRDAKAGSPSLIPRLGALNVPTVPASPGKPLPEAAAPKAPADSANPSDSADGTDRETGAAPPASNPTGTIPALPVGD